MAGKDHSPDKALKQNTGRTGRPDEKIDVAGRIGYAAIENHAGFVTPTDATSLGNVPGGGWIDSHRSLKAREGVREIQGEEYDEHLLDQLCARQENKKGSVHLVEIKFSRHGRRRSKLYKISESAILSILQGKEFHTGTHEILENLEGFTYPVKIVIAVENDIITVVTSYPVRRGRKG